MAESRPRNLGGAGRDGVIRLAFDASSLAAGNKSGVAYYTQGLIQSLADQYPDELQITGHYCNFLGRRKVTGLPQAPNIRYKQTRLLPAAGLNALRRLGLWIPFELLVKGRADFHLFPAFIGWPSLFRTPSAPVIHDVSYLEFPDLVSGRARRDLNRFVPAAIKRGAFVVTISETSAKSLQEHYGLPPSKVVITHVPPVSVVRPSKKVATECLKSMGIALPYVLFLGNIEPRKNLGTLLEAFRGASGGPLRKYGLVLAGGKGWQDSELTKDIEAFRAEGHNLILPGYVSDEQRAALFEAAEAFVLPSLYEGFGMTLLEAMAHETPVVASDITIFHEVCGQAALFFDPASPQQLAEQLDALLSDDTVRRRLIEVGQRNLRRFSWPEVAKTVYNRLNHD